MDIGDLFVNEAYELQDFEYKEIKLQVLCSKSATTDFDLTGQIIWPSAIDLGRFIIDNALLFKGKNVLELGAGAGLSGIVAYQYAQNVVITDGNEIVTKLIEQNVELHRKEGKTLLSRQFVWGSESAKELIASLPFSIDIIIGADIIFWQQSINGLAETIGEFSRINEDIKIFVTGAKRYKMTEDDIDSSIEKHSKKKRHVLNVNTSYNLPVYLYEIK